MDVDESIPYPYSAIPIEQIRNFLNVLVNLLRKEYFRHNSFLLSIQIELLGFKSCGIPPRKILQDNEGGLIENVRG